MFALNRLCASPNHLSYYKSTSTTYLLCRLLTSSSSSRHDDDKKERKKEYLRKYYQENKKKYQDRFKQRSAACREWHNHKRALSDRELEQTNPEKLEIRLRRARESTAARLKRPEVVQQLREYHKKLYADHNYAQRVQMRIWLFNHCPWRESLQWKTHIPIVYPKRTRKTCASCDRSDRGGARLWWKRMDHARLEKQSDSTIFEKQTDATDHELFDCHKCYTRDMSDMSRVMPVGHENHVFGVGMKYPGPP